MKRLLITLSFLISTLSIFAQEITGDWYGAIQIPGGTDLRINFHIAGEGNGYSSTMDSPDQNAMGIEMKKTTYTDGNLFISWNNLEYTATLNGAELTGTFKQAGMEIALNMSRTPVASAVKEAPKRPQEPKAPFPYFVEEVTFENPIGGYTLAGTFTRPEETGNYPVVVLISGSGPQNRDEEVYNHRPFWVIADYFARRGIATLRFDDRGTGESGGNFANGTTVENAQDVMSAVNYLRERHFTQIGLVGHSEGGIIAPMVAAEDPDLNFIILLAGPGVRGADIILRQTVDIYRAEGLPESAITAAETTSRMIFERVLPLDTLTAEDAMRFAREIQPELEAVGNEVPVDALASQIMSYNNPWFNFFIKYDPVPTLYKITKTPVLILNGDKDLQVAAEVNVPVIKEALKAAGNHSVRAEILPGLNHCFQHCTTGGTSEYATIEESFAPEALELMESWVKTYTRQPTRPMSPWLYGLVLLIALGVIFLVMRSGTTKSK